jgi:hypothetical protein
MRSVANLLFKSASAGIIAIATLSVPAHAAQWLVTYSGSVATGTDGVVGQPASSVFGSSAGTALDGLSASLSFIFTDPTVGATDIITNSGTRREVFGGFFFGPSSVNPLIAALTINGISYDFGATPQNRDGRFTIDNAPSFDQIAAGITDVGVDALGRNHSSFVTASVFSFSNNFVNGFSLAPLSLSLGSGFFESGSFRVSRATFPDQLDTISATGNLRFNNLTVSQIQAGAVPEPATWAMLIFGFAAAGTALRRRPRVAYA